MTQGQIHSRCLGLSIIVYTAFSTLVTDNIISVWGPAHNDPTIRVLTIITVRTVSLGLILSVFQFAGERFWARPILGDWAYRSSKGNFGIARIRFINDSLRYSVQLFNTADEVLTVLGKVKPVDPFAVVTSQLCQFESSTGTFQTDYHIESTSPEYKSRKGLLILTPTGPGQMKGQWYSTVDGYDTKSGDLEFLRPKQFRLAFKGETHQE
jgi:hypothetical protein